MEKNKTSLSEIAKLFLKLGIIGFRRSGSAHCHDGRRSGKKEKADDWRAFLRFSRRYQFNTRS